MAKRRRGYYRTVGVAVPVSLAVIAGLAAAGPSAAAPAAAQGSGPLVEARVKHLITKGRETFKDLNGNGRVDPYEDWHRSSQVRATDLISRMTLDEKAGMMHITSERRGAPAGTPVADPYPETVGYVLDRDIRHLVIRDNPTAYELADRANKYQALAEGSRLGIPIVFASNPRNHVNPAQQFGISEATGQFSLWPGSLGIAATHDSAVARQFAETARAEWRAAGIQKIYGYQIESATEPRWNRIDGTFGESPDLNAAIAKQLTLGFQGRSLDSNSVALTIKHFPGDGAVVRGLDPHNANGQYATYPTPGSLFKYQIPAFQAAIDAGASSVMSYYNVPNNELSAAQLPKQLWQSPTQQFEPVAGAYNKTLLQDVLRGMLGFKGYVNSDSGVLDSTAWGEGIANLTRPQRYAKAVKAGVSIFSDYNDPSGLIEAVHERLLTESELDQRIKPVLVEMFDLGLFEDPYTQPAMAQQIADSPASQAAADQAHLKSITLLRNDHGQLPLSDAKLAKTRLYVEVFTKSGAAAQTAALKDIIRKADPSVVLVDTPEAATAALAVVRPTTFELPDGSAKSIELNADTGVDAARVQALEAKVPTVLALNTSLPWVLKDIEPQAASVVATFDAKTEALWQVLRGKFNPTGRLPISLPKNQAAVAANASDVPGYAETFDYTYGNAAGDKYAFGFGLSYHN